MSDAKPCGRCEGRGHFGVAHHGGKKANYLAECYWCKGTGDAEEPPEVYSPYLPLSAIPPPDPTDARFAALEERVARLEARLRVLDWGVDGRPDGFMPHPLAVDIAKVQERVARLEAASGKTVNADEWYRSQVAQFRPSPFLPIPPADNWTRVPVKEEPE